MSSIETTVMPVPCYLHTHVSIVHNKADHIIAVTIPYM